MMRSITGILICSAALAIVLWTDTTACAKSGVKVERIAEATLGQLIAAGDNRLVLCFIAAWCKPCIDELPYLNKLYKKYKDKGFQLIGISIDLEGPGAIQPTVRRLNIDFPVYWCGEKAINKFNLNAIPMLVFFKRGVIVERLQGKRPEKILDEKIREFLKE